MIAEEKISEIRSIARISEFISPYVTLKRAGRGQIGLCPFHSEKSPSFSVNDENGFFHCFGCGVGGNVFKFLMQMESLSFPEAVRKVADHYGITVPESGSAEADSERQRLLAIATTATRYWRRCLQETPPGKLIAEYLADRGVSEQACEQFLIGAAPGSGDGLLRWLQRENVDLADAEKLGLLGRRGDRFYDKFRDRVIFPIRDPQGRVVGFGGRLVGDADGPKYLNTSDSPIYHKSRVLYGVYEWREARRALPPSERPDNEPLMLVEGYLDVIALAQAGLPNAVATCGTALTIDQARLMKRHASDVVALFDGDKAGRAAAARSFTILVEAGLWPRGAFLADGEDPDSTVRASGPEAILACVGRAEPLAEAWVRKLSEGGEDGQARARIGADLAAVLAKVSDPFERDFIVKKASMWTGISEDLLRGRARDARPEPARGSARNTSAGVGGAPTREEWLLTLIAAEPECVARIIARGDIEAALTAEPWAEALRTLIEQARAGEVVDISSIIDGLPDAARVRISERLVEDSSMSDQGVRERIFEDTLAGLEQSLQRRQTREQLASLRRREELGEEISGDEGLWKWRSRDSDAEG
ncbi:MAG: DNA primase [Hyphomicrobiaceae bacterium]|jgi:DNA primase